MWKSFCSLACHRKKKRPEWVTENDFHSALEAFHSSVCTYYRCQSASTGHYIPDMLSLLKVSVIPGLKIYCEGNDQYTRNPNWNVSSYISQTWLYIVLTGSNGFIFPSLAAVLGIFLCLYPILNWNAGVPSPPKPLAKLKGRVQDLYPQLFIIF